MRQSLTVYLVKPEYEEYDELLIDDFKGSSYKFKSAFEIEGLVVIGELRTNIPKWLYLLEKGTDAQLDELKNQSTRAMIIIKHKDNTFVFCFGFGRYLIKEEVIVKDFGMKVVLNSVDINKLRSIDTAKISETTLHSRMQTTKNTSFNSFGIDVTRDFLKAVTGEPDDTSFGSVISGKDALYFNYDFEDDFSRFKLICEHLEEKYDSEVYKENFDWIDNLKIINDRILKGNLDANLITSLNSKNNDEIHLSPPEIFDWNDIRGFSFNPKGEKYENLNIDNYYEKTKGDLTVEKVKKHKIYAWNNDDQQTQEWKVYNCLVYETEFNDETYVLTMGEWFKVDDDFVSVVSNYIRDIPHSLLTLPECKVKEKEGEYNDRVGREITNIITLDRKNVMFRGSPIEICDLLTEEGQFVHVKPWKSSSTLSHLFSQGKISAELMLQDDSFRQSSKNKISEIDSNYAKCIDDNLYDPTQIEIVYAIIDSSDKELYNRLPFFSKLNLMQSTKYLTSLRYNVTQLKIKRES